MRRTQIRKASSISLALAVQIFSFLPMQAEASFKMAKPVECFREWWDETTRAAFDRFEEDHLYEYEIVSDLALAIQNHNWEEQEQVKELNYWLSWPDSDSIAQI